MGKSKKQRLEEEDEIRQERVLEQLKQGGRVPTPPPGYFHDIGEKQRRRKDRKQERIRLKNLAKEYEYEEEE